MPKEDFNSNRTVVTDKIAKYDSELIHLCFHKQAPVSLEIWTRRGQSLILEGNDALEFIDWLNESIIKPIVITNLKQLTRK